MNNIPRKLRLTLAADPYYRTCARLGLHGHVCAGRITWEHALIFSGKQVQSRFAIVPLCAKSHAVDRFQDGGDLNKEVNAWIALNRASKEEIRGISRAVDYKAVLRRLNGKYGVYQEPVIESEVIAYPFLRAERTHP